MEFKGREPAWSPGGGRESVGPGGSGALVGVLGYPPPSRSPGSTANFDWVGVHRPC